MEYTIDELRQYYASMPQEFGFASMCKMTLPQNVEGMRVIDIGCRRGKGVQKFASRIGSDGFVLGVEPNDAFVREAVDRIREAGAESDKPLAPTEIRQGFFEMLGLSPGEEHTFDLVYANSSLNLCKNMPEAVRQMALAARPGATLLLETVLATGERDVAVLGAARKMGNAVQSAPSKDEFLGWLSDAGFIDVQRTVVQKLTPDAAYKQDTKVPCVDSVECVEFEETIVTARVPR
ncbi:arsenite S-adenosylmethyltransferase [Slackia heliotrinireducens]|uniref:Methylase involved in ubiquinone/menaquinone biosynthesis n=1 Tax=Slackia heliotrinireducens (strain ATCC 29202 / DSM 20476 / NCTC 11029 / RHS 1) TaxID=471855 RepID=C7N622_SLAHD|nr:methyltransferase domain-containing protein [Slackia heliotrinireducens]ACV22357.1 methylase involved in ubiquinone/menaquinone biosynthesis [Slackia heliotrinireducens DSM 20476]VEH00626.1 arsenite S-adenosylmethyltransferase [Slackia heliotrinireducens]